MLVDHGLLRKGEAEQVVETFREGLGIKLIHVDARERFLARLAGVDDPETKRKIIGEEFIRVFEEEALKLPDVSHLVQGTLYSDVIESGGSTGAATIKSHHNVGGLPDDLEFDLVEPLRMLFKDEVRAVASELGLSDRMVWRQPFPGPGLGDPDRRRRGQRGAARDPPRRRRDPPGGGPRRRPLPRPLADLLRPARSSARSASRATAAPTPTRS